MIDHVLNTIAPHMCTACQLPGKVLCESCVYDIMEEPFPVCVYCTVPTHRSNICPKCQKRHHCDEAYVVSWREGAVKKLIDDYKFERKKAAAVILADLIDHRLPILPSNAVITYIPTVSSHIRQRGYDHMRLIAVTLAKKRHLPVRALLIRRTQAVQRGANRQQRLKQPKDAFAVTDTSRIGSVVLIDDIVTTGATLQWASKMLRPYVDEALIVAAIGRQPLDDSHDL